MSKKILVLSLLLTAATANADTPDRKIIGEVVAITHSENFEYTCKLIAKEGEEEVPFTMWIDDNFNKLNEGPPATENFRIAMSVPDIGAGLGIVGIELKVTESALGKCAKTCYFLESEAPSSEGQVEKLTFEFTETGMGTKLYDLKIKDSTGETLTGSCELNEPI